MSAGRATVSAWRLVGRRGMSTEPVHPGYAKTAPIKEQMSAEDGIPVHIKRGAIDKALLGVTGAACLLALGLNIKNYFEFANK